jgi:HAMP domain-containing protein
MADQRRTIPILWNLWLLFACFLCGAIFVAAVTISLSVQSREMRQPALSSTFAEAARMAYESGGKEKLQEMIERLRKLNVNLHLLDTNGRDLVDRQDYSRLLTKANPSIGRASFSGETGSFTYLIVPALGDDYLTFWIKMLPLLAVLAFLAAGIVWYVAFRMRRLETALSRFGAGDLQIRMPADTRDSIGRLSRAFNQMADRIESLVHAQRRLCIDISHELRSPLARLRLAAGLAA